MIKVKDGYVKLIGTTYQGSSTNVLLSNGGNFPIHSGRNNEANKLVRTDSNGFLQTGWINTTSGGLGGAITRIYCSDDSYIRYQTPANFFSSLTNSGNNISITVAGQNRTLQVGYASNSDRVDNRHAISTTPNTGILYKSALYTPASLSSYWVKLASISSIGQNAEFVATIHVQSGHSGLGRSAILLVYLRGGASSFQSKSFKICCNSNYDPSRFRLYYRDSDKTSEIWYQTIGRWDGIITTVISQSDEGALYEGLTLYNGHINEVQTPSMSSYITAQVSTITDNISGNATTASRLQTSRTLWGQSFNGTANVTGSLSSVGDITMSGVMKSSKETSTYIEGNNGNALINSTAPAGRYVMLFRGVSTDGYFTHGIYQKSYLLQYTAKSIVDAGTNSVTKSVTLLDESGNSAFPGYVTSTGFKKSGSSDSYVLLGGGGHKTIDSFQTNYDGRYVKKSGDTMTGTLTTRNRVYAQLSGRTDKVGLFHSSASNKGGIVLADTNGTEHTLYLTTSNLQWKGRTVWDSGNDGSGSGLDADLLDGTHKSGLFTALSSSSSTNLSITIGGTTKAIADLYATQAVNADKLDNLQATSFMRCDGTNSIGLSGGNGNTAGWRLVLEKNCTNAGWSINNIVFSVASRHTGQGIMSIGFHTTNEDSTTYTYQINFKGSTTSNTSSPWRAFYNTSTKKFRLFWRYNDYDSAQINVLSRSGFNAPTNGTWYEALPSDNGTELTIYYNNAQTATQLLNSRKINGTSFNGTADITTSTWGATRSITLSGAVTGTVSTNGGGNITINTTYGTGNITNLDNRYVKKAGDTMYGNLAFSTSKQAKWTAHGTSYITDGNADYGTSLGGDLANLVIASWYGVSFTTSCSGQAYTGKTAVGINCRSGIVYAARFTGPLQGNATSATQLQTSRKINGTSFNGSADITTSYWGSTRTLTIGNTGKSVNGSGNVSWSLSEIGAAATNHTHGTLHSTFTTRLNNTTTDSGWSMINSPYNGFLLKSIRTQSSAPNWIENNYAAGICFGGDDTKGVLSIAYNSPAIKFAGGNGTKPVWWIRLLGASGATYNLANFNAATATKLATARTINGTNFDGTANITTVKWGTARTIYIQDASGAHGSVGVSVNGSTNYNLKLPSTITATLVGNASSATNADTLDGQHASAFSYKSWWHWSGQSGQPSWIWGGNSENNYYVYNPSNFSVNYAKSAGNADTLDGRHSTHFFRKYNRSEMGSSMNLNTLKTFGIFEIRTSEVTTTNAPMSGYYPLLNFVNGEHAQIQIAGTTGKLFYRAGQGGNLGISAEFTHSWATFIDSTNYTSYIKKIGTSTVGGADKPIYLNNGTPTALSSTKGSTSLPVYLNGGTITTCTPSSLFSNLSNSGTKLSISVAGQNRTLTVMYSTSTQYVVSSGNQTALSGNKAANSGIRLYEAYNNGYPISYGNLLSMKGRGSTELLMGWKSGANRMYYRSNSDINEGWTSWQTVATLADVSNAVNTGSPGHLAMYKSYNSIGVYSRTIGNTSQPVYISNGLPSICSGITVQGVGIYKITYLGNKIGVNSNFYHHTVESLYTYQVPTITKIMKQDTGEVIIYFSSTVTNSKTIILANGTIDPNGVFNNIYCSVAWYDIETIRVITKNGPNRYDGNFVLYIIQF